jgi:membrane protease YdiL (CAAX protease family)
VIGPRLSAAAEPGDARTMADVDATSARSTTLFFVLAFALNWIPLIAPALAALGVLDGSPDDWMAGAPIAIFGPTIAAVIASRREGGWPLVRELLAGLRAWRIGPHWYLVALGLPTLAYAVARAAYALVPGNDGGPWFLLPATAQAVVGSILVPIGEEIGWRGYALPRLIARHGAIRASVILGLLWAGWHLFMLLAVGTAPIAYAIMLPYFVAGSVVFTWLYLRTNGNLLMAVLLHVGAHLSNPAQVEGSLTPLILSALSYVGLAALLLTFDRAAFQGRQLPPDRDGVSV